MASFDDIELVERLFLRGYPLGEPDDVELQTRIIHAAFALLPRTDVPILESFTP